MAERIRRHLSFANVTSMMALFFAMGGTGYALTLPKNSVGSRQIKRAAVTKSDLRGNAVTSPCPAGTTIIGGGSALVNTGADDVALTASRPERTAGDPPSDGETFDRWRVAYDNPPGGVTGSTMARAFAVCAET